LGSLNRLLKQQQHFAPLPMVAVATLPVYFPFRLPYNTSTYGFAVVSYCGPYPQPRPAGPPATYLPRALPPGFTTTLHLHRLFGLRLPVHTLRHLAHLPALLQLFYTFPFLHAAAPAFLAPAVLHLPPSNTAFNAPLV